MKALQKLWTKLTSIFESEPSNAREGGFQPSQDAAPGVLPTGGSSATPPAPYSQTIDGVVFVTKDDALRLIKDGKSTPPSPELQEAVTGIALDSMAKAEHGLQKAEFRKKGLGDDEIEELIGTKSEASALDPLDLTEFQSKSQQKSSHPMRQGAGEDSKKKLEEEKTSMKAKIPNQQALRSKAIKKKKAAASAAKKRKNK